MSEKQKALLSRKETILQELQYYEGRIEDARLNVRSSANVCDDGDSSDSDGDILPRIDASPSVTDYKNQQKMLKTCLEATKELTGLQIIEHEANILVEDPVIEGSSPVKEQGTWFEVMAECCVDLIHFSISFYVYKPTRKFGTYTYRGLRVVAAKRPHEAELARSVLPAITRPADAVEVMKNYASAYRSRRSTLLRLADKFADQLRMEPLADGGCLVKCCTLLELRWSLQNKWSPVAPFHHRMKFDLEYMDESYIRKITQAHRQLSDPEVDTEDRTRLLGLIITTCLEAMGPTQELYESMSSDPETAKQLESKRTTLDREPDAPPMKRKMDSDVMAPPKSFPKRSKVRGKASVHRESRESATSKVADEKESTEDGVEIDTNGEKENCVGKDLNKEMENNLENTEKGKEGKGQKGVQDTKVDKGQKEKIQKESIGDKNAKDKEINEVQKQKNGQEAKVAKAQKEKHQKEVEESVNNENGNDKMTNAVQKGKAKTSAKRPLDDAINDDGKKLKKNNSTEAKKAVDASNVDVANKKKDKIGVAASKIGNDEVVNDNVRKLKKNDNTDAKKTVDPSNVNIANKKKSVATSKNANDEVVTDNGKILKKNNNTEANTDPSNVEVANKKKTDRTSVAANKNGNATNEKSVASANNVVKTKKVNQNVNDKKLVKQKSDDTIKKNTEHNIAKKPSKADNIADIDKPKITGPVLNKVNKNKISNKTVSKVDSNKINTQNEKIVAASSNNVANAKNNTQKGAQVNKKSEATNAGTEIVKDSKKTINNNQIKSTENKTAQEKAKQASDVTKITKVPTDPVLKKTAPQIKKVASDGNIAQKKNLETQKNVNKTSEKTIKDQVANKRDSKSSTQSNIPVNIDNKTKKIVATKQATNPQNTKNPPAKMTGNTKVTNTANVAKAKSIAGNIERENLDGNRQTVVPRMKLPITGKLSNKLPVRASPRQSISKPASKIKPMSPRLATKLKATKTTSIPRLVPKTK